MEIFTDSPEATQEAGRQFANTLKGGEVVCLSGDLGAGKTHFIQGLAEGLGIKGRVTSPTFIIMREYDYSKSKHFFHVDLYRLEENIPQELESLGLVDFWNKKNNIIAIEWADKALGHLPEKKIWVKIENLSLKKRKITIAK